MSERIKVKVCIQIEGRPFTYTGEVISKDNGLVIIRDDKSGKKMEFTRSQITYLEEVD